MPTIKLTTKPSAKMDKDIETAAGKLQVMTAPKGMSFAVEIEVDKAILKGIEKDPLMQSIMSDAANAVYDDLVERIGKNLATTDKGAITLRDANQKDKLDKLIQVVNKGIVGARDVAVEQAQKDCLKAWDSLVKTRKEYSTYKIKIGVKITLGLAGLGVSIGLLAGGVVSFGASSIPGIIGMVKSVVAIGSQVKSANEEIENAQKRLDKKLRAIEKSFVDAQGEFTKRGKAQEVGALLVEQVFGTSGPFAIIPNIKDAAGELGTIKSKFGGLKVNAHDAAKDLNSILEKLDSARKKFIEDVEKQAKKVGSPKAKSDVALINKQLDKELEPFIEKVQKGLEAVIAYENRYKTAAPKIAYAEKRVAEVIKLKGKGFKIFENVLVLTDLAVSFTDPSQYAKVAETLGGILPAVGGLAADKISKKVLEGTFLE